MKRRNWPRLIGLVLLGFVLSGVAVGCGSHQATTSSDEMFCIYDTGVHKGDKFVMSIPPGGITKDIPADNEVVKIPVSNRFYNATRDSSRDPGAPEFYQGFAQNSIKVNVSGQVRFRFNTAGDLPCEWYAKHGRRNLNGNSDLGFNVRSDPKQGWFLFLQENFAATMTQVVNETLGSYNWPAMVYNYAVNADDTGQVPTGTQPGTPTRVDLGVKLGIQFTKDLSANLGGNYFCGIDPDPNNNASVCPPIKFQVTDVVTDTAKLMTDRETFEATKQALLNAKLEGQVQQQNGAAALVAEQNKAALLDAQLANALKRAQIDNAKCIVFAEKGLDCDGHRPAQIVNGSTVK